MAAAAFFEAITPASKGHLQISNQSVSLYSAISDLGSSTVFIMGTKAGVDLWSEIIASEEQEGVRQQPRIEVIYQRRRPQKKTCQDTLLKQVDPSGLKRVSIVDANKRVSWNRSLSTRGRTSIAVVPGVKNRPQEGQAKGKGKEKGKPPVYKGKVADPPSFEKEREYFQEVDAFELLEESPSPKNFGTWAMGNKRDIIPIPHLTSRLEKWLISKKLNYSGGPSSTLSKIFETPASMETICEHDFDSSNLRTPEKSSCKVNLGLHSVQNNIHEGLVNTDVLENDVDSQKSNTTLVSAGDEGCEAIEAEVRKLSLTSASTSLDLDHVDPFSKLLEICQQTTPSKLLDVFAKYCDPDNIRKVGEGTYGEAFMAGNTVCKIVPFDGDLRVNGEIQKKSGELLEEAVLSRTLNSLRDFEHDVFNACTMFIETIDLKVCQGPYDASLIRAWEKWDEEHGSENDHPKEFPEKQCYTVFVLQHGGKDLESFVLENFNEARSLLMQVTVALAVAEAAYEFEHRDLHWGNILLNRNDSYTLKFILDGKQMSIRTFGLSISIIDFTLSRIKAAENILFLDLSLDPDLFKGPKGDKQSETYRKMKEVTEDYWEGSFPRTNVLWLLYLVDILLLKKTFVRSSKNERDLRSLKKRLDKYQSAKEAVFDPFFSDLLMDQGCE
ncbi:hypothetical protein SLE2022_064890 [Rubroshorea leprosula]